MCNNLLIIYKKSYLLKKIGKSIQKKRRNKQMKWESQ